MSLWLGHRTAWRRVQAAVGILNAYTMVNNLDQGYLLAAAISAFCVLVTASWRLPPSGDA